MLIVGHGATRMALDMLTPGADPATLLVADFAGPEGWEYHVDH